MFKPLNPPITDWKHCRVWIIGASSGIGAETARVLARRGATLALSARRARMLEALRDEFPAPMREAAVVLPLDIADPEGVRHAAEALLARWGGFDLVLIAAGIADDVRGTQFGPDWADRVMAVMHTNLLGTYHVLAATLPALRAQGRGHVAIISSVAGYNGLPKAMAYAPSKAALNNLCEGLYFELNPLGIGVTRICPGFVATPLTARNQFKMPALTTVDVAAHAIVRGLERGDFEIHFPKRFTLLVKLLRWLPRRLYFAVLRISASHV